jgi:hypothetical protein
LKILRKMMKVKSALLVLSFSPILAVASCPVEVTINDPVMADKEYQLYYSDRLHEKTIKLGKIVTPYKNTFDVEKCPDKMKADAAIFYTENDQRYDIFQASVFPNIAAISFSHSDTITNRSCAACSVELQSSVSKQVADKGWGAELIELLQQKPNYLHFDFYNAFRTKFDARVRQLVYTAIEEGYVTPLNIGAINDDYPNSRYILEQWLAILAPQKSFKRILELKMSQEGAFNNQDAMKGKVEHINPIFFHELTRLTRGFKDENTFSGEIKLLIARLLSSHDPDINTLVSMVNGSLAEAVSLKQSVNTMPVLNGGINNPKPDNIEVVIANWFRLLHTLPSETPEQLAMFSNRFRDDFMNKVRQGNTEMESVISAALKKYGKAIRYAPLWSNDKDLAAYNKLLEEFNDKAQVDGKRLTIKDNDSGQQLEWIYENNTWKLDCVVLG